MHLPLSSSLPAVDLQKGLQRSMGCPFLQANGGNPETFGARAPVKTTWSGTNLYYPPTKVSEACVPQQSDIQQRAFITWSTHLVVQRDLAFHLLHQMRPRKHVQGLSGGTKSAAVVLDLAGVYSRRPTAQPTVLLLRLRGKRVLLDVLLDVLLEVLVVVVVVPIRHGPRLHARAQGAVGARRGVGGGRAQQLGRTWLETALLVAQTPVLFSRVAPQATSLN